MSIAAFQKSVQIKTTTTTESTAFVGGGPGSTDTGILPANTATMTFGAELLDDTDFTSTGFRSRIRGLKDYSFTLTALWDATDSALPIVRSALFNDTTLDIRYLPDGVKGFQGQVKVSDMSHSGDVAGLETVDITFQATNQTDLTTL